jgi:hypothetical protein
LRRTLALLSLIMLVMASSSGQQDEILKLKEKIIEIQNKGELGFRYFTICSNIISFASYVPLLEPVVEKNGTLLIYFEPVNIFTNKKNGLYEIWYTQDMALFTDKDKLIIQKEDALNFHYTTKSPVMDLYATNSINLTGLAPGKYKFKATLKDKLKGKKAEKMVEFEVK